MDGLSALVKVTSESSSLLFYYARIQGDDVVYTRKQSLTRH